MGARKVREGRRRCLSSTSSPKPTNARLRLHRVRQGGGIEAISDRGAGLVDPNPALNSHEVLDEPTILELLWLTSICACDSNNAIAARNRQCDDGAAGVLRAANELTIFFEQGGKFLTERNASRAPTV